MGEHPKQDKPEAFPYQVYQRLIMLLAGVSALVLLAGVTVVFSVIVGVFSAMLIYGVIMVGADLSYLTRARRKTGRWQFYYAPWPPSVSYRIKYHRLPNWIMGTVFGGLGLAGLATFMTLYLCGIWTPVA